MDIERIAFAAEKFFEMCAIHPEICPHDYHWTGSTVNKETREYVEKLTCSLCGKQIEKTSKLPGV